MSEHVGLVTSYVNPDTDGVACMLAVQAYFARKDGRLFEPVYAGSLNAETCFVLDNLGLDKPRLSDSFAAAGQIILVDTHHVAQLADGLPLDRVTLVVDHHPDGDDARFPQARIINEEVGAAATLVAEWLVAEGCADDRLLRLLQLAIFSNTLNLTAPSTSERDRNNIIGLQALAPLADGLVAQMFEARSDVCKQGAAQLLRSDLKVFEVGSDRIGIAQVEVYGLLDRVDRAEIARELERLADEQHLDLLLFNGVDINEKKSLVVAANAQTESYLESLLEVSFSERCHLFNRIMLRKTDFIPLLGNLEKGGSHVGA